MVLILSTIFQDYIQYFSSLCQYYRSEYVHFSVKYSVLFHDSVLFLYWDTFLSYLNIQLYSSIVFSIQYYFWHWCSHFVYKYIHFSSCKLQQTQTFPRFPFHRDERSYGGLYWPVFWLCKVPAETSTIMSIKASGSQASSNEIPEQINEL